MPKSSDISQMLVDQQSFSSNPYEVISHIALFSYFHNRTQGATGYFILIMELSMIFAYHPVWNRLKLEGASLEKMELRH